MRQRSDVAVLEYLKEHIQQSGGPLLGPLLQNTDSANLPHKRSKYTCSNVWLDWALTKQLLFKEMQRVVLRQIPSIAQQYIGSISNRSSSELRNRSSPSYAVEWSTEASKEGCHRREGKDQL